MCCTQIYSNLELRVVKTVLQIDIMYYKTLKMQLYNSILQMFWYLVNKS